MVWATGARGARRRYGKSAQPLKGRRTIGVPDNDPAVATAVLAIHHGDLDVLRALLAENPDLAEARARGTPYYWCPKKA